MESWNIIKERWFAVAGKAKRHLCEKFGEQGDVIIVLACISAGITYSLQMGGSLWWDELYTVVNFVDPGPWVTFTADYHNNNHMFFSFLSYLSTQIFGRIDVAYQIPSTIFGILALWLSATEVKKNIGKSEGVSVAVILFASPLLLYWVPQARGYGVTLFASALMLSGGLRILRGDVKSHLKSLSCICLAGVFGIVTLPHFAIPFTFVCATLAVLRREIALRIFVSWVLVGLATAICYIPGGLWELASSTRGSFGPKLSVWDSVLGPFRFLVIGQLSKAGELKQLVGSEGVPFVVAGLTGFLALGVFRAFKERTWSYLLLAVVPLFGTYTFLVLLSTALTDRTLLFLFPFLALAFAMGIGFLVDGVYGRLMLGRRFVTPMLWVSIAFVFFLNFNLAFKWSEVPKEAFHRAVDIAYASDARRVLTDSTYRLGFTYYADRIEVYSRNEIGQILCQATEPVAYIAHNFRQKGVPLPTECLEARQASSIKVDQRRRGTMAVWLVPGLDTSHKL